MTDTGVITTTTTEPISNNNNNDSSTNNTNTTNNTDNTTVVVSAPGKMLLAGGYLILDESNIGLVIGVNARFYASCTFISTTSGNNDTNTNEEKDDTNANNNNNNNTPTISIHDTTSTNTSTINTNTILNIHVKSPQFGQEWKYIFNYSTMELLINDSSSSSSNSSINNNNNTATTTTLKRNIFLEKAIRIVLLYIFHNKNQHLLHSNFSKDTTTGTSSNNTIIITILGNNDFYSILQQLQYYSLHKTQINQLPNQNLPIIKDPITNEIYKTGLGSSACLVTVVIASILYTLLPTLKNNTNTSTDTSTSTSTSTDTTSTIQFIERLSQIGHCYAQGKIGSGFDISAAIYGSHVYQRFQPMILQQLLLYLDTTTNNNNDNNTNDDDDSNNMIQKAMDELYKLVHDIDDDDINNNNNNHHQKNKKWYKYGVQQSIDCFGMNTFLQVMMADVSGGSESPSMAKHILQWKNNYIKIQQQQQQLQQENNQNNQKIIIPHWDDLIVINRQIIDTLQQIHYIVPIADTTIQELYINIPLVEWKNNIKLMNQPITQLLILLHDLFIQQRYHMKQMGICAGNVPIEPDIQTTLCNTCTESIPGVIATLVPGAGGYDAISCIYINHSIVYNQITTFLCNYTIQNLCPLTVQGVPYGSGLQIEAQLPNYIDAATINTTTTK